MVAAAAVLGVLALPAPVSSTPMSASPPGNQPSGNQLPGTQLPSNQPSRTHTSTCAAADAATHVVGRGETWFGIAAAATFTMRSLLAANDADETRVLYPGDVLCLPGGASAGSTGTAPAASTAAVTTSSCATHTVVPNDTWFGIAMGAGVSTRGLLEANGADEDRILHPGDTLCLPAGASAPAASAPETATYTVRSGDGWFRIAQRVGVTARALLAANESAESRVLHPGDAVKLPSGASAPAATSTTESTASSASSGSSDTGTSSAADVTYTVGSGDSWFMIAQRVQSDLRSLYAANDASESRALHPGDVLRLPVGSTWSGSPSSSSSGSNGNVRLDALPMHGPCWYSDSWHAPRGGGRLHKGVDMFAEVGNYIYAVVDGTLTNRTWDRPGLRSGNAWHLTADDGSGTYFFYAHLADFAPGLEVGSKVRAGEIIGFMGNTGNSAFPHLHFEVHPNGGAAVNPYPIVRAAGGCKSGNGYEQPGGWIPTGSGYR